MPDLFPACRGTLFSWVDADKLFHCCLLHRVQATLSFFCICTLDYILKEAETLALTHH